jgi:hypothetical protein
VDGEVRDGSLSIDKVSVVLGIEDGLIDGDIIITTPGATSYTTTATASGRSISRPMDENSP